MWALILSRVVGWFRAIVPILIRNWRVTLEVCAAVVLMLLWHLWTGAKEERDFIQQQFDQAVKNAREARDKQAKEYDDALTDARKYTAALVEQAETNAVTNYVKRFGKGISVRCSPVRPVSVSVGLPVVPSDPAGAAQAGSPENPYGPPEEFVAACATDAARLDGWQHWARELNLPVKE